MNRPADPLDELGTLAAALCDGAITPQEATRLEQLVGESDEARQYFLRYVQLDGELYWENAASARDGSPGRPGTRVSLPPAKSRRRRVAALATVAAVLAVAIVGGTLRQRGWLTWDPFAPKIAVARLAQSFGAKWTGDRAAFDEADLVEGQTVRLLDGVVEIRFNSGAGVILQGPATLDVLTPARGFLHSGSLTAVVPPEAAGFAIQTPTATLVDRGTAFGVAVKDSGASEVHVFLGSVEVRLDAGPEQESRPRVVAAGDAVEILAVPGASAPRIGEIALARAGFVRTFPVPGSVARLRYLAARHPNLMHHYTFEGTTPDEKLWDRKRGLDLIEVVMRLGSGEGALDLSAPGFDETTGSMRPFRARRQPDETGVGLVSESDFHPPSAFTVELLLNFDGLGKGEIGVAVGTRASSRDCGLFVVAAGAGYLLHLMDGEADWVGGDTEFTPGEWFYVAGTFRQEDGGTRINTYVANLSRRERTLQWVVRDQLAPGLPAVSRLGIGKGFGNDLAHAYPWSGAIDEVAIYDAPLDRKTLQKHLFGLIAESRGEKTNL